MQAWTTAPATRFEHLEFTNEGAYDMRRFLTAALIGVPVLALVGFACARELDVSKKGKKLDMKDYTGQNFEYHDFEGCSLWLTRFKACKLKGSSFKDCELESAYFDQADCTDCDFTGAHLKYTGFQETILANANLEGQDFTNIPTFLRADMRGANLRNTKNWRDINMTDLRGAKLQGAIMLYVKSPETAKWKRAEYDSKTRFPDGIDPAEVGAVLKEE